jgi:hypothetical protein
VPKSKRKRPKTAKTKKKGDDSSDEDKPEGTKIEQCKTQLIGPDEKK